MHAADIQDRDGGALVMATMFGLYPFLLKLYADGGYQGPVFRDAVTKILARVNVEIVKRSDQAKGFVVLPKRWVVERTFAWLGRCRRLAKDWDVDFPTLKFIIPHGGGAAPYHWGRYRGLAINLKRPPLEELLKNVYFDTCVYHLSGIELLTKVVPADNILSASEMVGAVKGVDPQTGYDFDDTKRYLDQVSWLTTEDKHKIFEGNARKVYSRLGARRPQASTAAAE